MQKGFINEKRFASLLDHKKLSELPENMQNLLLTLFKNISPSSYVECWQSKYLEKADIKVKINGILKGISIKTGNNCSMHQESFAKFSLFLLKIGVADYQVAHFHEFILGYVQNHKVDAKTYVENNKDIIGELKNTFNEYYIKTNLLMRFLFQGTEIQNYDCDAIIYGTPEYFIWATKDEILEYLINYPRENTSYLNVSALNIKCYDRNLKNNPNKRNKEEDIQIKWPSIKQDLLYLMKVREAKLIISLN